jgi:hypothetical protein
VLYLSVSMPANSGGSGIRGIRDTKETSANKKTYKWIPRICITCGRRVETYYFWCEHGHKDKVCNSKFAVQYDMNDIVCRKMCIDIWLTRDYK